MRLGFWNERRLYNIDGLYSCTSEKSVCFKDEHADASRLACYDDEVTRAKACISEDGIGNEQKVYGHEDEDELYR